MGLPSFVFLFEILCAFGYVYVDLLPFTIQRDVKPTCTCTVYSTITHHTEKTTLYGLHLPQPRAIFSTPTSQRTESRKLKSQIIHND